MTPAAGVAGFKMDAIVYVSLASAFVAGLIALFAPCCVTYLLPAYFGSIFKERKKVFLMTVVFSLGIFLVMLPAVLGVKAISNFTFRYHDQIYLFGGALMVIIGFLALLGVKLPMPRIKQPEMGDHPDVVSVFGLGVVSGITSACCAPVLAGVLTLSAIAPSFWLAILVGVFYVMGMVFPLYIMSYFLDSRKVLTGETLKRSLGSFVLAGKEFTIIVGNFIAFLIFSGMGFLVLYLTLTTDFSMAEGAKLIQDAVYTLQNFFEGIPFANLIFGLLVVGIFVYVLLSGLKIHKGKK